MDDYNVCLENGLSDFLAPVDDYGRFTKGAGDR
jgi:isoleucyl-tRNA synthetase